MKPFDLEAAKRGEQICNRDGENCVFITHVPDAVPEHRVLALTPFKEVYAFNEKGLYYCEGNAPRHDLFMAPRKRTVWVNLYPSDTSFCSGCYDSEISANNGASPRHYRIGNRAWPLEIED